jgi:hypothetical protein
MDRQVASRSTLIRPLSGMLGNHDYFIRRPPFHRISISYLFLLSYAIKGSPNQKLLLEDIYYAIESRVCIIKQYNHSDFNIFSSSLVSIL